MGMSTNKLMSVRSLFLRLNHERNSRKTGDVLGRNDLWLTEDQLKSGTERFIKYNGYQKVEFNWTFDQGGYKFTSPIVGYRNSSPEFLNRIATQEDVKTIEGERHPSGVSVEDPSKITTTICIINPKIQDYDLGFFGFLESVLYDIIDSYENTNLILVTDSLSYLSITKKEEISVTVENLMEEGLHLLFLNEKSDYAFFEKYEDLTEKPIMVYGA